MVEVFSSVVAELGEGPVWDAAHDRLVWVDIDGRAVHLTSADGERTRSYATPAQPGAAVLRAGGGLLLATGGGFATLTLEDGAIAPLATAPGTDPAIARMNDGEVDPAGRFWAGTKAHDDRPGGGILYRLELDGTVTQVLAPVTCSNGLAWSLDGTAVHYIDTTTRAIVRFPYDAGDGAIGAAETLVDTGELSGWPDGMAIDADGNLWVAFWGGWCVRCFAGSDGTLLEELKMPVEQPSSVAFGGEGLRTLFVTSARTGLDAAALAGQPDAGRVHMLEPGVAGVPARVARV
jgi:sugar lactone lactonase YvrE